MTACAPSIYCPCGHKSPSRRVCVTDEGARFLSGVCGHCGDLVVQPFPALVWSAGSARPPENNVCGSPDASAPQSVA